MQIVIWMWFLLHIGHNISAGIIRCIVMTAEAVMTFVEYI